MMTPKRLDPIHPGCSSESDQWHRERYAETWLGLQVDYELRVTRRQSGEAITQRVRRRPAA
jgi:hypothetical protein